jgi:hypothetical protein
MRSFIESDWGGRIKEDEMGGACSPHGREAKYIFWLVNVKGRELRRSRHRWENVRTDVGETENRDSSVAIALGYGLDDRSYRVRFPMGAGNFSLHHRVQNGSGVHPASCPMGTRGSFPGGKAAGA